MEHGDMHLNNLMINANDTLTPTYAAIQSNMILPVSVKFPYLLRVIDFGFARSDHVFGSGDIRTCLSIESVKRISFGDGKLWPCELYDMACILSDIKKHLRRARSKEATTIGNWLTRAMESLEQTCLDFMNWSSMEDGYRQIQITGLYPLSMSQITGEPLKEWLIRLFPSSDKTILRDGCLIHLPQSLISMRPVPRGTPLTQALLSMSSSHPMRIETDAVDV
jgi:hypothetical protein